MRSIPNPNPLLGQSSPFEPANMINVSSRSSLNSNSNSSNQVVGEPQLKRKRGRPRKYGPDGGPGLALSPLSVTAHAAGPDGAKRGRGRPPGSGRKQQLASLGEFASTAGMGFTPHLITIAAGEDIAAKIFSLSEQGPKAVSILSASGAISSVTLRSGNPSGIVRYEGRYDILCLSGSFIQTDEGRTGGLNVSLSSPDGRVVGGVVGGLLRAATPVHVVVGSFIYGGMKMKKKPIKTDQESSSHEQEPPISDDQSTPLSSLMGGWPISRQMDMRNSLDIDLTRG